MLLQINKIIFEKSKNLEKNPDKSELGKNFNRKLYFFKKRVFSMVFLEFPRRK